MRWLAAISVILLAFGVFVYLQVRSPSSAEADADSDASGTQPTPMKSGPAEGGSSPAVAQARKSPRAALPAIIDRIRTNTGGSRAEGSAPALDPTAAEAGSGSAEIYSEDNDYRPYADGTEPSSYRVKIRGAARRMRNGNFKGAFEAADSLIQMWPDSWEAYSIAVPSLCAMGDDRAASYFGRVTDEPSRAQIIAGCAEHGVTLGP